MANQIMTQEFAETIAATIKRDIPILEYVNKELSDRLESGSGATVSVLVPNFGKVSKGASFLAEGATNVQTLGTIADLNVQVDKVPVTLQISKVGASYDLLEKTLKLYTKDSQISEPRISNLARTINAEVFKCVFTAAHSSIVGPIGFEELAEAVAYVDESRVGDENAGMLSPLLNNTIAASGANKFAHPRLGLELYNGALGSWMDAEFFKSADAGNIKLGNNQAQAFAITGNVANVTDGASTLALSGITIGGTGNTLTVIPAGTPIIIGSGNPAQAGSINSPFTVSNVYGDDTQIIRTFVVMENATITAGAANVKVAPIYLNQNVAGTVTRSAAAVPNTWYSGNAAQANLTFICPLLAGAKYALGAVFASKSIAFASASPRPFANADSSTTTLDGEINARTSIVTDGREGQDVWRVDTLYGMAPLYGTGSVALYGQII
jgi:hypothetical protein